MKIDNFDFAKLIEVVPQTYGEVIQLYPWIKCESHEWDNRTTIENAVWLIRHLLTQPRLNIGDKLKDEDGCEGYVVIRWADGDICYLENDAAHPNPRVIGHWTPAKIVKVARDVPSGTDASTSQGE